MPRHTKKTEESLSEELIDSGTQDIHAPQDDGRWRDYLRVDELKSISALITAITPINDPNIAKERLELLRAAVATAKGLL